MNALKAIRKRMRKDPDAPSSRALARLVAALAEERSYPLAELYAMDRETFDLAIELLTEWRLDRYYAARLKLFDFAINEVMGGEPDDGAQPRQPPAQP